MNGSGYPKGLTGDKILLEARIIIISDVVEAMSSHRPYRPQLGIDQALLEIEKNSGILYDPDLVGICLKLFREKDFDFKQVHSILQVKSTQQILYKGFCSSLVQI